MSAAGEHRTATAGESPAGRDSGHASNASNGGHGGDLGEDSNDRHDDRHTDRHADGADGADDSDTDDALLAPVALSGAFPLPERLRASLPEPDDDTEAWMVSGLVVDSVARCRGVGRVLLTAVAGAVRARGPAADLYSVVNASNHASIGLHLVVGFEKVAQLRAFGAVTFEGGRGVLLRRAG